MIIRNNIPIWRNNNTTTYPYLHSFFTATSSIEKLLQSGFTDNLQISCVSVHTASYSILVDVIFNLLYKLNLLSVTYSNRSQFQKLLTYCQEQLCEDCQCRRNFRIFRKRLRWTCMLIGRQVRLEEKRLERDRKLLTWYSILEHFFTVTVVSLT